MAHLIHVGNSLGVRIPKAIILQSGFDVDTPLEFKVTNEGLLISPKKSAREGWEKAYKAPLKGKKEKFLMEDLENQFDRDEWEW